MGCGKGGKANGKAKSRSSCAGLQFPGGGIGGIELLSENDRREEVKS